MTNNPSYYRHRTLARISVVQTIYRHLLGGENIQDITASFEKKTFILKDEKPQRLKDIDFFKTLITFYSTAQQEIAEMLEKSYEKSCAKKTIEPLIYAILAAGLTEIMYYPQTAMTIIINEYLDITHSFYTGNEPKIIHVLLDSLSKKIRSNDDNPE